VDAIVGARQLMHTVISETCTGCDLCLAPCPVDCIEMRPTPIATLNPPASNSTAVIRRVLPINGATNV
jgi:RnfABCDGE-type electron transport complex B subunit